MLFIRHQMDIGEDASEDLLARMQMTRLIRHGCGPVSYFFLTEATEAYLTVWQVSEPEEDEAGAFFAYLGAVDCPLVMSEDYIGTAEGFAEALQESGNAGLNLDAAAILRELQLLPDGRNP